MLKKIYNQRTKFGRIVSKKLIKNNFTIISDDCWGGQIYRQLSIPYCTPTVGLWIAGDEYLRFIENLNNINTIDIQSVNNSKETYPIGKSPYAELHFMHYENFDSALQTFKRRYHRINWDKLLYKIDLEKPGFNVEHIKKWNDMKLPNSIAFYSDGVLNEWGDEIHNGVYIKDWVLDGSKMFDISRSYFNIFKWVNTGVISKSLTYSLMNFLLFDPTVNKRLKKRL